MRAGQLAGWGLIWHVHPYLNCNMLLRINASSPPQVVNKILQGVSSRPNASRADFLVFQNLGYFPVSGGARCDAQL